MALNLNTFEPYYPICTAIIKRRNSGKLESIIIDIYGLLKSTFSDSDTLEIVINRIHLLIY